VRYYDTSALVKQYLQEAGSKLVLELLKSGEKVYTASLTYAEGHAAFSRRTREGRLTRQTARRLALRFDKDWESYDVVDPGGRCTSTGAPDALSPSSSVCGCNSSCFGAASCTDESNR
jgi:hypothetical protein